MSLSTGKLLNDYMGTEELKEVLRDIGELTTGKKDKLVLRIIASWESHNRDIYDLLDFVDDDFLEMICDDYNLDSDGDAEQLIHRIKSAKLLVPSTIQRKEEKKQDSQINISGKNINIGDNNRINSNENNIINEKQPYRKIQIIVAIVVGFFIIFGVVTTVIFQTTDTPSDTTELENDIEAKTNDKFSYVDVLKTFDKNRPYYLSWTSCSFTKHFSIEGEKSWSFTMRPVLVNNIGEPAIIPFNISYFFRYEPPIEQKIPSFNPDSETIGKHLVDPKQREAIVFEKFMDTLVDAQKKGVTKIQIIQLTTGFVPYSEVDDDNVVGDFRHDREEPIVTEFFYDSDVHEWKQNSVKNSICSELYRI